MAKNYVYHSEAVNEEEGACALDPRLRTLGNMPTSPMEAVTDQQQQQQQLEKQQFESPIVQGVQEAIAAGQALKVQSSKPYTNIAVKGLKIESKLNPLAPEFYPSHKQLPINGYITNMPHQVPQMPNAAAMAAAATAAQYGYLDYDCNGGYADWPTYEYDVARCMDYERFMTNQMQRSNTSVTLVRNDYSGSGSAAPPSGSTSFQDQPSFENSRKNRSFSRSYSGTSYNFRKHQRNSKEISRENMRSWYIDKEAEEKRMESWKNIGAEGYQDAMPGTSSKDEFYDLVAPKSDFKDTNNSEKQINEYKMLNFSSPHLQSPMPAEESQRHTARNSGGNTTASTPRKIKSQRKLRKENTEMSKKKLIMLYPAKRNVNDHLQSSQDSMFTQPDSIEYTSDESFLTQLSSSQRMQSDIDKMLNADAEVTDSLENFEVTTKTSDPTILNSSKSVSPVSVIEQEKHRKLEKPSKSYLEPKTALKRPKKETDQKSSQKQKTSTSVIQKATAHSSIMEKEKETKPLEDATIDSSSPKVKQAHAAKELKSTHVPKGKNCASPADTSKDDSKMSKTLKDIETTTPTKNTPKTSRVAGGVENVAHTRPAVYTGAIPKTKEKETVKNKETVKEIIQSTATSAANPRNAAKVSATGAIPKVKDTQGGQSRKPQLNNGETPVLKTSRGTTHKTNTATSHRDDKPKVEHPIQRPPDGIVANRVQIFSKNGKHTTATNNEKSDLSHKRQVSKNQATIEKRTLKATNELTAHSQKQSTTPPTSSAKKSTASTISSPAAAVDKRSVVAKPIVKTQMRGGANQDTTNTSNKKLNSNHNPQTPKKESSESKKSKSVVAGSSRNALPTSSKSNKTGSTKVPAREKSSSLRGVKAVIGSDGDKNVITSVKSSRSCISLRHASKALTKKPSATSTKVSKKQIANAANLKKASEAFPPSTTLRSLQMEKRRNPYSDPGADYKIVQTSLLHK